MQLLCRLMQGLQVWKRFLPGKSLCIQGTPAAPQDLMGPSTSGAGAWRIGLAPTTFQGSTLRPHSSGGGRRRATWPALYRGSRVLTHNHANLAPAVLVVAGDHCGHGIIDHRHHLHLEVLPRGTEATLMGLGVSVQPALGQSSPKTQTPSWGDTQKAVPGILA